jgi:hypothetical protein
MLFSASLHFLCSWPVSRVLCGSGFFKRILNLSHHLSCHSIAEVIIRPTPRHRTSSPQSRYTWSFNPSGVQLPASPQESVSSYLAFSPLPRPKPWRLFSVTLLYPRGYLPVRKNGALCCPDFPSLPDSYRYGTMGQPAAPQR